MNSSNAGANPSLCFSAQTTPQLYGNLPRNEDVGGAAVAVSNIVINIALPILLHGSDEDVDATVLMLLSQVYPIMISTALSINSDNLSLFDAHFTVAVTASPVSCYLAYSAVRDVVNRPNKLFSKRLTVWRTPIRRLGLALPVLWLGISFVVSFSSRAFRNSPENCQKMTLGDWLEFQVVSNFVGLLDVLGRRDIIIDVTGRGGLGAASLTLMWIWEIYLVRHRYDILNEIRSRQESATRCFPCNILFAIVDLFSASWVVVSKSHPWIIVGIVGCLHWNWVLGISKGMIVKDYKLSYGQIMSFFSMLPPLMSVYRLLRSRWVSLISFLVELRGSFSEASEGVQFLLRGTPNPWLVHEDRKIPLNPISVSALERYWPRVLMVWLVTNVGHAIWIMAYVRAGSTPNPRTPGVNKPHRSWKIFSVALFVFACCVCWINILVWTSFFDRNTVTAPDRKHETHVAWWRFRADIRRRLWLLFRLMFILIAFLMCVAPLALPFAALPIAEQIQWAHICDPFYGYVILKGAANPSQTPTASFYYPSLTDSSIREFYFEYSLIRNTTGNTNSRVLVFNGPPGSSLPRPDIQAITYVNQEFFAHCNDGLCALGNYSTKPYLSFDLQDWRTGTATQLRAVDEEWEFGDDAPTVVLRIQLADGKLGDIALQSAVTQRNHCDTLKVCLSTRTPDYATLAPLGVLLMAQDRFADYCSRPRIYAI